MKPILLFYRCCAIPILMMSINACAIGWQDFYEDYSIPDTQTNLETNQSTSTPSQTYSIPPTTETNPTSTSETTQETIQESSSTANTPPILTIKAPENNAVVPSHVMVWGTASDDHGVSKIEITLDGSETFQAEGSYHWSYGLGELDAGNHTLLVTAVDSHSEQTSQLLSITVATETEDPSVTIGSFAPGDFLPKDFTVSGSATDNNQIASIRVAMDDNGYATATGTTSWSYDFVDVSEGYHTLRVAALDLNGNEYVLTTYFRVDQTKPLLDITSHVGMEDVSGTVPIFGTFQDLFEDYGSNVQEIQVCVEDSGDCTGLWESGTLAVTEAILTPGEWGYDWDTTSLTTGNYTLHVKAIDSVGNESTEATVVLHRTTGWQNYISGALNSTGTCSKPDLAVDDSQVFITYLRNTLGTNDVIVQSVTGGALTDRGILDRDPALDATSPAIAVLNEHIYAAWCEKNVSNVWQLYVSQFDGANWQPLGDSLNSNAGNDAYNPDIAICPDVTPYPVVCWRESGHVRCKSWNGVNWITYGSTLTNEDNSYQPSIAFRGLNPYVLIRQIDYNDYYITPRYWTSTGWSSYGGNVYAWMNVSNWVLDPNILVNDSNTLFAAFRKDTAPDRIYVYTHNGSNWTQLSGSELNENGQDAVSPKLAFGNGRLLCAFQESDGTAQQVYVKEWNSPNWDVLNSGSFNSNPANDATQPTFCFGNGMFLLAFVESSNIYMKNY